jgi:hypothetical protein
LGGEGGGGVGGKGGGEGMGEKWPKHCMHIRIIKEKKKNWKTCQAGNCNNGKYPQSLRQRWHII